MDTSIELNERSRETRRTPILVVFVVQHSFMWNSWRSVYQACNNDPRFTVHVILTQYFGYPNSVQIFEESHRFLREENIPFYTPSAYELADFKPDVIFLQNPYDWTRTHHLQSKELIKLGYKIAYIPYGLEMGGGKDNRTWQFDLPVQRNAWRIFARSERHRRMFDKYCQSGSKHVVVTGHPKIDNIVKLSNQPIPIALKNKIAGRRVILWPPHYSVGNPPAWSTYHLYSQAILEAIQERQELFLLIRPHPFFFSTMRQKGSWSANTEQQLRQLIDNSTNIALDEASDYLGAFAIADAIMADVGSFLLEFLPTKKPILYLHHPRGLGVNDDGDLVQHYYRAESASDIQNFMDMIIAGQDPMRQQREDNINEYLLADGHAAERIRNHIAEALQTERQGDTHFEQELSEKYWRQAETSYFASAEFYDRKEQVIHAWLEELPHFPTALDLGCSDGRYTRLLAKRASKVVAIDISPSLITRASEETINIGLTNIQYQIAEADGFTSTDMFNLVSCMGVSCCIIDEKKFSLLLDSIAQLTVPEGYLLIGDTFSCANDSHQITRYSSGYIGVYRNEAYYLQSLLKRDFIVCKEHTLAEQNNSFINKLFLLRKNK